MVSRGTPNIRRVHAKNFITEEADARLREVTPVAQQQGLNALGVDSHEVYLYLKKPSTQVCTCKEVQVETNLGSATVQVPKKGIGETHEITFDWKRPLFGEPADSVAEEDCPSEDEYAFDDEEPVSHPTQLLEASADCAICYRSGFLPGFEQYGKHRVVLTTHHVSNQSGYTIDRQLAPHVFERMIGNGWVEFEVQVPKYFKAAAFSIRNNREVLDNTLFTATGACDLAFLRDNAGKKVGLRVNAPAFTHVVLVFDLGAEPIRANISQLSKATDWTLFNTIGSVNVILPMTVPELDNGSYIIAPKFKLAMIVTDVTYNRVAEGKNIEWSVNTRVSQPQEAITQIHKTVPIL